MFKVIIYFVTACCGTALASNILMILPLGSRSHKNIFIPLAETLATEGHDVSLVSMHPHNGIYRPAYNDIAATEAKVVMESVGAEFNMFEMIRKAKGGNVNSEMMKRVMTHLPKFCEAFLKDPAIEQVWNLKPDVILVPAFMNECALIFVEEFRVPFIYVTTSGLTPWTSDLVGTPEHPAYVPNQYLSYSDNMNLLQRTINTIARFASPLMRERFVLNRLDAVAKQFLNKKSVSLAQVEKNVSMVFVNSHVSLRFPRPLGPNVIEIGGMHCRKAKPLAAIDPELNDFVESSEHGSILFSLGSHIQSSDMPDQFRDLLLEAFERLPYNIVWKWENDNVTDIPSNVMLRKWLPQQDLLGHTNLKAFFTHGGLLSTQEAVYHGVPIVGLPLVSDQNTNVKLAEELGFAIKLDFLSLSVDSVVDALTEIIENPVYKSIVQEKSLIMRDQETTPLQRASYWTKYVIRHKGAEHLKSKSLLLSTTQYLLLDVLAVIACVVVTCLIVLLFVLKFSLVLFFNLLAMFQKKSMKHLAHHIN